MESKSRWPTWASVLLLAAGTRTLHAAPARPASPPVPAARAGTVAGPEEVADGDETSMGDAGEMDDTPAQRADEAYEEGTNALDEEQWEQAIHSFDDAARQGGARADGALYWKAYAQRKSGHKAEALSTIAALRSAAPRSKWLKEAQVLEMEMRQDSGERPSAPAGGDEELQLMALNSLMTGDAARAVPMLEGFLSSNRSRRLRDKALFVLTQSGSPEARALVTDIARGKGHADLQRNAIKYLGLFGGPESRDALRGIYMDGGADVEVKKAVLQAYMVSGDVGNVLQVARSEKAPELRRAAIHQLGAMGGQDQLWQLYGSETDVEVKKAILQGIFVGGGEERLIELSRTEANPELRRAAVRNLALIASSRSGARLLELYRDSDPDVRREAVQGLFIQGNAAALVQLARAEKDPEWRKKLVQQLAIMDSDEARRYMLELLK